MKKQEVQIIMGGQRMAVLSMGGDLLKMVKTDLSCQETIFKFLDANNFVPTKEAAANFPYLGQLR